MNIRILSCIDIILFHKAQHLKYIYEVTVKILKSPNKLLQDTLFLTPLISFRPFFCILNTALLLVVQLVEALCYKWEGRGFDSQ
jgi:hypothetical protein